MIAICERQLKLEGKDNLDSDVTDSWIPVLWKWVTIDSKLSPPTKKFKPSLPIDTKLSAKKSQIKSKHSLPVESKQSNGKTSKKRKILPRKVISSSSEDTSEPNESIYHFYTSSSSSSDSYEDERVVQKAKHIRKKFFK